MAIRHVVVFRWIDSAEDAQVDAVDAGLAALPGLIPEIRHYQFGRDVRIVEGNADYAVVAQFDSPADFLTYRDHPEHRRVITEAITPIVAARSVVQFETG